MMKLGHLLLLCLPCYVVSSQVESTSSIPSQGNTMYTTPTVVLNEIANKGTELGSCGSLDWVELYNSGNKSVDLGLERYGLHDDGGPFHEKAFLFPYGAVIPPNEFMVLCLKSVGLISAGPSSSSSSTKAQSDPMSPQFGIGSQDTVTLIRWTSNLRSYQVVSFVGPLNATKQRFNVTHARNDATGVFEYTSTPTPGTKNTFTPLKTEEEYSREHKEQLKRQNEEGTQFFGMDSQGLPVDDSMDTIVELKIVMNQSDYDALWDNPRAKMYVPFQSSQVTTQDGHILASLPGAGRIRLKGWSTFNTGLCMGVKLLPFVLDVDTADPMQTLFGVQRLYLRQHQGDLSYARDWAYNKMLARFGLPHLRTRKVRFYINEEKIGFYTLMESPDQEYVFARSFPGYDPSSYALYKYKFGARFCGEYPNDVLRRAKARLYESSTPPYSFQRGYHQEPLEVLGILAAAECGKRHEQLSFETIVEDTALAYLRYDSDCSEMLLKENLIDLDLGKDDWDDSMRELIQKTLTGDKCGPNCGTSDLKDQVDLESFLKHFAFYAVAVSLDAPIGEFDLNNFYLAQTGFGSKWKLVAYDLNAAGACNCNKEVCGARLPYWSIGRPTCSAMENSRLVGPLLTDPTLLEQYLNYAREFLDNVYTDAGLIQEIQNHIADCSQDIRSDMFSLFGAFASNELSPEASNWTDNAGLSPPLLPFMKKRAEELYSQFAAMDAGRSPREDSDVSNHNDAWETCSDWRLSQHNRSTCPKECYYDGCHKPGWTVESWCDEATGSCYHGDRDDKCAGVVDFDQYSGMQPMQDGIDSFCRRTNGIPVKAAQCPNVSDTASLTLSSSPENREEDDKEGGGTVAIALGTVSGAVTLLGLIFMIHRHNSRGSTSADAQATTGKEERKQAGTVANQDSDNSEEAMKTIPEDEVAQAASPAKSEFTC